MEVGTLDFVFVLFQVVVEGIKNKSNVFLNCQFLLIGRCTQWFFFLFKNKSLPPTFWFFFSLCVSCNRYKRAEGGNYTREVMVGTVGGPTVFFYSPLTLKNLVYLSVLFRV